MENSFADFLINAGLYDSMEIKEENISELIALLSGQVKLNCFCTECGEMRIFSTNPIMYYWKDEDRGIIQEGDLAAEVKCLQEMIYGSDAEYRNQLEAEGDREWEWKNWQIDEIARIIVFKYICSLDEAHHLDFIVLADNKTFKKIGQYPSFADLSFPELKQYQKVISKVDIKELRRAIGLYAQGIGVGSYVYLRRVLERLIEVAKNNAVGDNVIKQEEYDGKKVIERIKLLKDYLPDMLVSNSVIYGIISKGIHELSEEDCLSYFPIVRECIFMILEQWEQQRKKVMAEKRVSSALGKIASRLSNSNTGDMV